MHAAASVGTSVAGHRWQRATAHCRQAGSSCRAAGSDAGTHCHCPQECPHDLMLTKDLFSSNPTWQNLTADAVGKIAGFVDFDWCVG